jgi:hypothetical protein
MSKSDRAYYLWEDDKKESKPILSEKEYWLLANNITIIVYHFNFFKDSIRKEYDECSICLDYLAKLECVKCKQTICGRCLLKIDVCPYCRHNPL